MSALSRIVVPTPGGPIPGDLVTPEGAGPWPGVAGFGDDAEVAEDAYHRVFAFFHEHVARGGR